MLPVNTSSCDCSSFERGQVVAEGIETHLKFTKIVLNVGRYRRKVETKTDVVDLDGDKGRREDAGKDE
jgi:hypothetical protein